jgi:hypothetical protein
MLGRETDSDDDSPIRSAALRQPGHWARADVVTNEQTALFPDHEPSERGHDHGAVTSPAMRYLFERW